ncbi:CRISPR-associated endoribonuclease Cas6 [Marinicrinis sediminis]|uniref:CRISPR-associated endoribonuclease Cas6 n=1 Tax=Marinicrinis sediminis TaxID=1652465 RepID=A0ABW5R6D5_9BACL
MIPLILSEHVGAMVKLNKTSWVLFFSFFIYLFFTDNEQDINLLNIPSLLQIMLKFGFDCTILEEGSFIYFGARKLLINILNRNGGEKMRFKVTYEAEWIPVHYRMKIYSLLKEAIKKADISFYQQLFEQQRQEIKPFSTAVYLRDFRIEGQRIYLKDFSITVSSTMEFAIHAFNGFREMEEYMIGGVKWKQSSIQLLREAEIASHSVILKTLSPILVEDQNGKPLSPTDEGYEKELNYFANLQIRQAAGRELYRPIRFTPINMQKMVVKESNRIYQETHPDQSLYYTAYKGLIKLEGHWEDLQILYQLGIGKRTAFFGLTDYIREEG